MPAPSYDEYTSACKAVIAAARQHPQLRCHACALGRDIAVVLLGARPGCLVDYCYMSQTQARQLAVTASDASPIAGSTLITADLDGTQYFLNARMLLHRIEFLPHDCDDYVESKSLLRPSPPTLRPADARHSGPAASPQDQLLQPLQSQLHNPNTISHGSQKDLDPPYLIVFETCATHSDADTLPKAVPKAASPEDRQIVWAALQRLQCHIQAAYRTNGVAGSCRTRDGSCPQCDAGSSIGCFALSAVDLTSSKSAASDVPYSDSHGQWQSAMRRPHSRQNRKLDADAAARKLSDSNQNKKSGHVCLDTIAGLPLLPTLNGWLLGYPVVFLIRSSEEAAFVAAALSSTPLLLCEAFADFGCAKGTSGSPVAEKSSGSTAAGDALFSFTLPASLISQSDLLLLTWTPGVWECSWPLLRKKCRQLQPTPVRL